MNETQIILSLTGGYLTAFAVLGAVVRHLYSDLRKEMKEQKDIQLKQAREIGELKGELKGVEVMTNKVFAKIEEVLLNK